MKRLQLCLTKLEGAVRIVPSCFSVRGPLVALLPLALIAPLVLAGPIRWNTKLSLPVSCAIASVFCAVVLWVVRPRGWGRGLRVPPVELLVTEVVALSVSAFAVWALYNRDFDGFMNLDGWDGGSHVFIKDRFATTFPDIYNGQVSFFGFAWLIERILGVDSFRSFTVAFYVSVVATVVLPLTVTFGVIGHARRRLTAFGLGAAVAVLASVGALLLVLLPLLHYNQAAGYYPHLFGLIPLLGLWAADTQIRCPLVRVGALLFGLALVRYTYALNLADVSMAVAALLLVDETRGWNKAGQAVLALGLTVAAIWIASQIAPVFRIWGGIQGYAVTDLLRADLMLLAGLLLYVGTQSFGSRWRTFVCSPLARALRFPVFFAAANAAFFTHFRHGKKVQYYYPTKYQMWACMLLALALVLVLAHLAASSWRKGALRSLKTWLGIAIAATALAAVSPIWLKTFSGYRTTLFERMRPHGPPYKFLRPLADVEGIARIETILAAQHRRFGGYLTSFFPMFSFMNGTLGRHPGIQEFFPPAAEPGTCVFWISRERDTYRLGPADRLDALRNSVAAAGSQCAEYPVPWKATPQSLCYHCY
jgi:hypothetical protein